MRPSQNSISDVILESNLKVRICTLDGTNTTIENKQLRKLFDSIDCYKINVFLL